MCTVRVTGYEAMSAITVFDFSMQNSQVMKLTSVRLLLVLLFSIIQSYSVCSTENQLKLVLHTRKQTSNFS